MSLKTSLQFVTIVQGVQKGCKNEAQKVADSRHNLLLKAGTKYVILFAHLHLHLVSKL